MSDNEEFDVGPHIVEGGLCMMCFFPNCDRPYNHEGKHRILQPSCDKFTYTVPGLGTASWTWCEACGTHKGTHSA